MGISDYCYLKLFAVVLFSFRIIDVLAAGNFELQILEISNTNSHILSGYCCGVPLEMRNLRTTNCPPCTTIFRLCLKEYHSDSPIYGSNSMIGCSFGNASSSVLGDSSFVLPDPEIGSIVLPFSFRWTKSFTLILQAIDFYNSSYPVSEQLIEEATFSGVILPSPDWNTLDHVGKNARITYRIRVQCAPNYYNTTCTTFCRPRNDQFGHYICGYKGDKVCLAGWQGINCEKAVCKIGCDAAHGKCDKPGECECRLGWRGPLCDECMVYPGCRHGSCNGSAWQCICDTNWGGILCDQDLNYCGTHEPCMHGGTCENTAPDQYRCTCKEGLSGVKCEVVEHPCATYPCQNGGTCRIKKVENMEQTVISTDLPILPVEFSTSITIRGILGMSSMGKPSSPKSSTKDNALFGKYSTNLSNTAPEFDCTCLNGWAGTLCEINIDECAGGPCQHGGACIDLIGGFRCICIPEWTGDVCEIDVNECTTNASSIFGPCLNAESCENLLGSFKCNCLDGWGGATCAQNFNDCENQCQNGATCIDMVNEYHCACGIGYTGRNCETNIDDCAGFPCLNGGECEDKIDSFNCICPVGYFGPFCEEATDHCTLMPCVEGSCLNTPGGYYCHCPPGRSGRHCELVKSSCFSNQCNSTGFTHCSSNPCMNGGFCINHEQGFICECNSGWSGITCMEKIIQCTPSIQCLNGGSCIITMLLNGATTHQCRCMPGWAGTLCADPIDQCQGQPCHNGGVCESGAGWFRCNCALGFSGPDCRINVNECSPQPCFGDAICVDRIGSYTCICPQNRWGKRCEILLADSSSPCSTNLTVSSISGNINDDENNYIHNKGNCNSCTCINNMSRCSNLWCGLPNCLNGSLCKTHEVCVPSLQESCLYPPCQPQGDCRGVEPSRRVAPPNFPTSPDCWPNQAKLNENCARISILLDKSRLPMSTSVEDICKHLRILIGIKLHNFSEDTLPLLIVLCDIKTTANDTIEVTVSSIAKSTQIISETVSIIGTLLSRQGNNFNEFFVDRTATALLSAIIEIKVETALMSTQENSFELLFNIISVSVVTILLIIGVGAIWYRYGKMRCSNPPATILSTTLDGSRCDEEKSNNLQNEENFRRYANPLKSSAASLHGTTELCLQQLPEISPLTPGPSAVHRSQPIFSPAPDTDFEIDADVLGKQRQRSSQILLYKPQNSDMRKNTMTSIENCPKDFGKRAINCNSLPPLIDTDILTVHV